MPDNSPGVSGSPPYSLGSSKDRLALAKTFGIGLSIFAINWAMQTIPAIDFGPVANPLVASCVPLLGHGLVRYLTDTRGSGA